MRDNVRIGMGHTSLHLKIDMFLSGIGFGFNPARLRRARLGQIIALEQASDADLDRMGLDRDGILPHVFRDLLT